MTKKEQIKLIGRAFDRLDYALGQVSRGQYGSKLFKMIQAEERQHRRSFGGHDRAWGLSIAEASRLFYARSLVCYLSGDTLPRLQDYLWTRESDFLAGALVSEYPEELKKAIHGLDLEAIKAVDYAELVKVEETV